MLIFVHFLSVLSCALAPQQSAPPQPDEQLERPKIQRIRVGGNVAQAAYPCLACHWYYARQIALSDTQVADLEKLLLAQPDDVCTRGVLIACDRVNRENEVSGSLRVDHLLWMIRHRPDWDGFLLNLSEPRSPQEEAKYDRIRSAWLDQVGPDQRNGMVLHHAAVFLAEREPDLAVALLERAILLEPDVPFHVERLGMLYGDAQLSRHLSSMEPTRREDFARRAREALLSSGNRVLLEGALSVFGMGVTDFTQLLRERLKGFPGGMDWNDLPSRSAGYWHTQCDDHPLPESSR
jgi:hypothetical protein